MLQNFLVAKGFLHLSYFAIASNALLCDATVCPHQPLIIGLPTPTNNTSAVCTRVNCASRYYVRSFTPISVAVSMQNQSVNQSISFRVA